MKFLFKIIVVCLFSFNLSAAEMQSDIWPLFIKKSGNEKFLIRFPEDPEAEYKENQMDIISGDYSLKVISGASDELLKEELKYFIGFKLLAEKETPQGKCFVFQILDGMARKATVQVTKENIYVMMTRSKQDLDERHDRFSESFLLTE